MAVFGKYYCEKCQDYHFQGCPRDQTFKQLQRKFWRVVFIGPRLIEKYIKYLNAGE